MGEAFEACQALLRGERWCVFMRGGPGRGKTHLAKATVRARLEAGGTALFRKVPRLLDDLRDTYNRVNRTHDEEEQARSWNSLSGQLEIMRSTGLLVLDDFGAQKPTEWASEKLYTVIDDRYEARAPLIVTTNVRPSEEAEHERTLDRLAPGAIVIKLGESRRMEFDL
jgi:DNA replication protein DnaC